MAAELALIPGAVDQCRACRAIKEATIDDVATRERRCAFRKMALLRVVPRSTRTFVFYEMAPGLIWAVIFHTQKNDLYLSQLADEVESE